MISLLSKCAQSQQDSGEIGRTGVINSFTTEQSLALYLQSLGVKPDSVVGLCVERSLEMMVGIMGIVQAGGLIYRGSDYRMTGWLTCCRNQAVIVLTQERFKEKISGLLRGRNCFWTSSGRVSHCV
jgi:hypothetical protein